MTLLALLLAIPQAQADSSDQHQFEFAADLSWIFANSDLDSWLYRGNGKLRYDEQHDGLRLNRIFLDYKGRITPTLTGELSVNMNNDVSEKIDLLEAFLEWRPIPRSEWRFRSKLGAFYPHISLENVDAGWSNKYALTSSAINTWIGEELRTIGAELRIDRRFAATDQQISLEGAIYGFNDPTGAVLTWRGWAVHDRQTGITGAIPMPEISVIEAWAPEGQPIPKAEPFKEIDNRPGFYVGAQWRWSNRLMIKAFHYDNHADPLATSGDDYAWKTWFDHVGIQAALPGDIGLIGQWIAGSTLMGRDMGPWHVQDVDFDSTFVLLTRAFGKHRLSTRYEWFDLQPYNDPPGITNQDKGNSAAIAWLYEINDSFRLGTEYMQIRSTHCKSQLCFWTFNGLPRNTKDSQLLVSLRWSFDNH
jgi:hypothetical protein